MSLEDWLSDHHKTAYHFQLERMDKIRDRVSFLTGLLTALGGAIVYVALNYPHEWRGYCSLWFYLPAAIAIATFLTSSAMVFYAIAWGFKYMFAPTPQQIQDYTSQIKTYAKAVPAKQIDPLTKTQQYLSQRHCQAATYNLGVNTRRANTLLRATQLIVLSFILILFALPRFFVDCASKEAKPSKIIISEPIRMQK